MVNDSITKKTWLHNGEKIASSTNSAGRTGQENETKMFSFNMWKNKFKMG